MPRLLLAVLLIKNLVSVSSLIRGFPIGSACWSGQCALAWGQCQCPVPPPLAPLSPAPAQHPTRPSSGGGGGTPSTPSWELISDGALAHGVWCGHPGALAGHSHYIAPIVPIALPEVPADAPIASLPSPAPRQPPRSPRRVRAPLAADGFVWQRGAGVTGHHVPAVLP